MMLSLPSPAPSFFCSAIFGRLPWGDVVPPPPPEQPAIVTSSAAAIAMAPSLVIRFMTFLSCACCGAMLRSDAARSALERAQCVLVPGEGDRVAAPQGGRVIGVEHGRR